MSENNRDKNQKDLTSKASTSFWKKEIVSRP